MRRIVPRMAKDFPTIESQSPKAEVFGQARHTSDPQTLDARGRLRSFANPLLSRIGETPRQASLLFSAQMGSTVGGFFVATLQMHWMEPAQIGRYAFCLALVTICGLVFEFGLFPAGGRVLALLSDRQSEKKALGALVLLGCADGVLFSMFVAVIAFPTDWAFKQDVRWVLIGAAAAGVFLPAQRLVEESCQGLNRIRMLSEYRLMTAGLQLAFTATLGAAHRLTPGSALVAYLLAMGPPAAITIGRLGVSFKGSSEFVKPALGEIRSYGLNAYLAAMTGTASTRLDNLIINYLIGAEPLGLYFSAQRFSAPLSTMARTLAITRFRVFARLAAVPRRIVNWNTAAMIGGAGVLALGGPLAIRTLFPRYAAAAPLFVPFAVSNLFLGLFQPYNMFLASHGRGAELRNIAAGVTVGGLASLFIFVPAYGIAGAAWAGAVAMLVDYLLHLYYYRKLRRMLESAGVAKRAMDSAAGTADAPRPHSPSREEPDSLTTSNRQQADFNQIALAQSSCAEGSRVVLLDLSTNPEAARDWARQNLDPGEIRSIAKADLKWGSKIAALRQVRLMNPGVFAVFCTDLAAQSGTSSMQVFGALGGAHTVVLADAAGRTIRCSRYRALLLEPLSLGLQLAAGYLVLAPLAWILTLALELLSPVIRSTVPVENSIRANAALSSWPRSGGPTSRPGSLQTRKRSGLYLRATPASGLAAGGMATHVAGFAGGVAAAGHRLDFISGSEVRGIDPASSDVHLVPLSARFNATRALFELWNSFVYTCATVRIYREHCRDRRWEFIYQRYNRFNCAGVLLSSLTGLPLVLEYNGSEVWVGRNWDPVGLMPLLKRFERINQRRADLIVVVSAAEADKLHALEVPAGKIVVNPNGVDPERFRPGCAGAELRTQLGLQDKVVIGFLGSFGPWHGTEVLARAAVLLGTASGCHFLFIGGGDLRAQTESILAQAGCAEIATFVGTIPHALIPRYLDACDILAAPHVAMPDGSPYFGSPTKLFEYLAMARPVVASRLGQMSEILTDGENALLTEPGDASALAAAIRRLAEDAPLRERLGAAARLAATSQYTWRHNAARVLSALEALLEPRDHAESGAGGRLGA